MVGPKQLSVRERRSKDRVRKRRARSIERKLQRGSDSGAVRDPTEHQLNIDGEIVISRMYGTGRLAMALGICSRTVRRWEGRGILPKPLYRDHIGMLMYTQLQVDKLVETYAVLKITHPKLVNKRIDLTGFPEYAARIWKKWPHGVEIG